MSEFYHGTDDADDVELEFISENENPTPDEKDNSVLMISLDSMPIFLEKTEVKRLIDRLQEMYNDMVDNS